MISGKVSHTLLGVGLCVVLFPLGCFSTTEDPGMHAAGTGGRGSAGSGGVRASMHKTASGGSTSVKGTGGARVGFGVDPDNPGTGGARAGFDGGVPTPNGTGGQPSRGNPPLCGRGGLCEEIHYETRDKLDLLFMIDNSDSMSAEQEALRNQFPHMIDVLTSGDLDGDGTPENAPASSIHVGVVTSDMGLPEVVGINNCQGLGQDGILQSRPSASVAGCQASYPPFLKYDAGLAEPSALAKDFQCIATVGTGGCGFEQPLEAVLKALWPSVDPRAQNGQNRILFLPNPTTGQGQLGHGDVENAGFLRNDPSQGLSMIAIVALTDEDDCSMNDTRAFTPPQFLDPADPLAMQSMNTRCHFNKQALYPMERYVNGLRALRPGNEDTVIFALIAGVPADLSATGTNVDLEDDMAREAFYAQLLGDPRMQERVNTLGTPDPTDDRIVHSCEGSRTADPPVRLVQAARGFGKNGIVESICTDDFAPAMSAITARIGSHFGADCLPQLLARNSNGFVACDLLWELPPSGLAPAGTPVTCSDATLRFLAPRSKGAQTSASGGAICSVRQLPVANGSLGPDYVHDGDGWYYDDFSPDSFSLCTQTVHARARLTDAAKPPLGVTMVLDCDP